MFDNTTKESQNLAEMLDRKLTFSYSTLLFLQKHNFDIPEALRDGVPYLSREEAKSAMDWMLGARERQQKRVDPKTLSEKEAECWNRLRGQIQEWLEKQSSTVSGKTK